MASEEDPVRATAARRRRQLEVARARAAAREGGEGASGVQAVVPTVWSAGLGHVQGEEDHAVGGDVGVDAASLLSELAGRARRADVGGQGGESGGEGENDDELDDRHEDDSDHDDHGQHNDDNEQLSLLEQMQRDEEMARRLQEEEHHHHHHLHHQQARLQERMFELLQRHVAEDEAPRSPSPPVSSDDEPGTPEPEDDVAYAIRLQREEDERIAREMHELENQGRRGDDHHNWIRARHEEQHAHAIRRARLREHLEADVDPVHQMVGAFGEGLAQLLQHAAGGGLRVQFNHGHGHGHGHPMIDPDNMDYEQLLEFERRQGRVVPLGADDMDIVQLPSHKFQPSPEPSTDDNDKKNLCCICYDEFAAGDDVKTLPCLHRFHEVEIDRWLRQKNSCPVCNTPIT